MKDKLKTLGKLLLILCFLGLHLPACGDSGTSSTSGTGSGVSGSGK